MGAAVPLPYAPPQMHYIFGGRYKLDADFKVGPWTVPAGYVTDLASSPRIFWVFIPPTGAYEIAAVLHDWFCSYAIAAGLVTSREADRIFRWLMSLAGVPFYIRWPMWAAVRFAAPFSKKRRPSGLWRDAPGLAVVCAPIVAVLTVAVRVLVHLCH